MRHVSVLVGLGFTIASLAGTPRAHASDGELNCGCRAGSWNAPDGALVLSRSDSIVGRALAAGGETSSHSMLSHGNAATHAALDPDKLIKKGWPSYCTGGPITGSSLAQGRPGMTAIMADGAAYAYLQLSKDPLRDIWWQLPPHLTGSPFSFENPNWTWAKKISNAMNYLLMYEFTPLGVYASNGKPAEGGFWYTLYPPGGERQPYYLHQFVDIMARNAGGVPANLGAVCSTSIAWGEYVTGYKPPFDTSGIANPYAYSHDALIALSNSVMAGAQSKCDVGSINELAGAACGGESICDDFGRQVRNCLAAGKCGDDNSSIFNALVNTVIRPYTISPARLGGWDGHGENGHTPWTGEAKQPMTWAGPGNVCSCWSVL